MKEKKIKIPDPCRPTTPHSVEEVEFGVCIFNTGLRRCGKCHPSCAVINSLASYTLTHCQILFSLSKFLKDHYFSRGEFVVSSMGFFFLYVVNEHGRDLKQLQLFVAI